MGEADWNGVCLEMRTRGGVFWTIPVTLSASDELATRDGIHLTVTGEPTGLDAGERAGRRLPGP